MSFLLPLLPDTVLRMESMALCMLDQCLSLNHTPPPDVISYITSSTYSLLTELGGSLSIVESHLTLYHPCEDSRSLQSWDVIWVIYTLGRVGRVSSQRRLCYVRSDGSCCGAVLQTGVITQLLAAAC